MSTASATTTLQALQAQTQHLIGQLLQLAIAQPHSAVALDALVSAYLNVARASGRSVEQMQRDLQSVSDQLPALLGSRGHAGPLH